MNHPTRINLLRPSRTVVTSSTPRQTSQGGGAGVIGDGDAILNMAVSNTSIACALSRGQTQVYDRETLQVLRQTPPTPIPTLDMQYSNDGALLYAAQYDGCVSVWDLRQAQPSTVRSVSASPLESLALGYRDTILATGTASGKIVFTDARQPSQALGSYTDSHAGAVTSLSFQNTQMVSGSDDGLMVCFDTTQPTEEAATMAVCNVGNGARKVGFCSNRGEPRAFALGTETISIWNCANASCLHHYGDMRQFLSTQMGRNVDYLIDAQWETDTASLILAVGSIEGNGAVFHLTPEGRWRARQLFTAGHVGMIRAWHPLNNGQSFVTAGDDARVVEWKSHFPPSTTTTPTPMPPSSVTVRHAEQAALLQHEQLQRPKRLKVASPGYF